MKGSTEYVYMACLPVLPALPALSPHLAIDKRKDCGEKLMKGCCCHCVSISKLLVQEARPLLPQHMALSNLPATQSRRSRVPAQSINYVSFFLALKLPTSPNEFLWHAWTNNGFSHVYVLSLAIFVLALEGLVCLTLVARIRTKI